MKNTSSSGLELLSFILLYAYFNFALASVAAATASVRFLSGTAAQSYGQWRHTFPQHFPRRSAASAENTKYLKGRHMSDMCTGVRVSHAKVKGIFETLSKDPHIRRNL